MWRCGLGLTIAASLGAPGGAAPMLAMQDLFTAGAEGYAAYRIPGIIVTARGVVLAYCEARRDSASDWADIDLLLRRSTDGGATWGPRQLLAAEGTHTVNNPVAIADHDGSVHFLYCVEYARCFYRRSDDDGQSFSPPVEITPTFERFRPEYDWNVCAPGPGHGIQLRSGRLLVPVWLSTGGKAHRPSIVSVIYSDDRGVTWQRGDVVAWNSPEAPNPSETAAVQLAAGGVLLNIRNESPRRRRLVSLSADGATGWSPPTFHEQLYEPVCMAGLLHLAPRPGDPPDVLLYSHPDSEGRASPTEWSGVRENLTLRLSTDGGATWPTARVLDPGPAGYSDLAEGPDGTISCFYERGRAGGNAFHPQHLTVVRLNRDWVTAGGEGP
jgi:sialidase-1